ncbi:hypothetical protein DL96DRAFT_1635643 [Flagelloscypha sp. PMI_526]|nr:hypothetical protein DL96DRAFT_1635643 [Flagelloscypha sp. PMI_526]
MKILTLGPAEMMPAIPPDLLTALQEQIRAGNLTLKFEFAALSILIWDYLLTFNLEFSLIWSRKFTGGTLLFLLTRYLPFTDLLVGIIGIQLQDAGDSRSACPGPYAAAVWLDVAGIQISELILILRTWALYGQNKWILAGLLLVQAGSIVYCGIADQAVISSIVWAGPEFSGIPGCIILSADNLRARIAGNYVGIVALETLILVLTCFRAFCFRGDANTLSSGSFLIQVIRRDGLVFYFFILSISIVNVVVIYMAPLPFLAVLIIFQRTMHSVATGRILLHIRQVAMQSVVHVQEFGSSLQGREVWQLDSFQESVHASSFPHFSPHSDVLVIEANNN